MNYSILLLGASITISLFIRICCATEANALLKVQSESVEVFTQDENFNASRKDPTLFLQHDDDNSYKNFLKFSTFKNLQTEQDPETESRVDKLVDRWIKDSRETKKRKPQQLATHIDTAEVIKRAFGEQFFQRQVCGLAVPPNFELPENGTITVPDLGEELPQGCVLEEVKRERDGLVLTCRNHNMTIIPQLPYNTELAILDVSGTSISEIPVLAFRNVTIGTIRLHDNDITYIDPYAFHGVHGLQSLSITENNLEYLAYEMYIGLDETHTLNLSYNSISLKMYESCPPREIEEIQTVLPNLKVLSLAGNPLQIIPYQMFAGLRSSPLSVLYLSNCYLEEIHRDAFSFLPDLTTLHLSGNRGKVMESLGTYLRPLTNLQTLYLKDNGLTSFPHQALSHLQQLKILALSDNAFISITHEALSKFPNLEELDLDNCQIRTIEKDAFSNNHKLTSIRLLNNKITEVSSIFPPSLKTLLMTTDASARSNVGVFQNLTHLSLLELSGLRLDTITRDMFKGLTSLNRMFLDGCSIQRIEDGAFKNLTNLNTLSLRRNPISELSPEALRGLTNLKTLHLTDCQLTFSDYYEQPLESNAITNRSEIIDDFNSPFKYIPQLEYLDLSGNQITRLSANIFRNLTSLKKLTLSKNPIQSWRQRLFPERTQSVYNMSSIDIYSFQVEIAESNIQSLTNAMVEDFLRISTIDLSKNSLFCDEGACKVRDLINSSLHSYRQVWTNEENYFCIDINTRDSHNINSVSDSICAAANNTDDGFNDSTTTTAPPTTTIFPTTSILDDDPTKKNEQNEDEDQETPNVAENSSNNTAVIFATISISISLIITVLIILAYRNRVHLRTFWFRVQYNVSPRKAKISTVDSTCDYDYDVFISYHNEDSKFIADVFLPEIEQQESQLYDRPNPDVFIVENDRMCIMKDVESGDRCGGEVKRCNFFQQKQSKKKFKVCLHERDFEAGLPITENIVDCVDRSRKMIIFVSKKYMESQWCTFEMNLVYHRLVEARRKSFALVLLEDIPGELKSKVLNYLMVTKTYLQWPGVIGSDEDKAGFWRRLRAFLQSEK